MSTPQLFRPEHATGSLDIEHMYLQYHDRLYRYLVHLVGDREQAQELTQDVFVRVIRALPNMTGDLRLSAWLYRIATNIGYDALRRWRLVAWHPLDELDVEPVGESEGDPQVQYGRAELVRQALLLYTQEGYSYAQIASLLQIAESGVKMYLSRARRFFRQRYLELEQEVGHV